jgi:hypothetical protein
MLSENGRQLVSAVAMCVTGNVPPTEQQVRDLAGNLRIALAASGKGVTDEEFSEVLHSLHARLAITMETGVALVERDHVPWLAARKPEIEPFYWKRFSDYLLKGEWSPHVVGTLDRVTDEILDLFGNPALTGKWKRRGLVIGDVQSGKTATYTALTCKAADAGYRVVILLTGTLESLRRQTQQRMDEGFVGLDSSDILTKQSGRINRVVGAGELDQARFAGVFTSRTKDFNKNLLNSLGFTLKTFREPILLVVKKNKRILENLENWLRAYNVNQSGLIDEPMLLIDDEADNASVNTAAVGADPTSINERIRALLALFTRASYVGFTATPFANVFIDPDNEHDMLGHDLFPRDFIYALEPPTNYVGATRIFGDESIDRLLFPIQDADPTFPAKHKSTLEVSELPDSLMTAIRQFFLANAIRDLREEGPTHRSMLVNVSRFTAVQDQVAAMLDATVRAMQQDVRSYCKLPESRALQNSTIADLKDTWEQDFQHLEFQWGEVQRALLVSTLPIVVRAVNQRTGAGSLDYAAHRESGLRVVAVGGMSLSRGLTLEGLCTSYFYRNSQMYDTLMQMGRWFGYRDGYADVCRLWLTEEAQHWYAHVTLATEELRDEVRRMRRLSLTPKDFGLKVRAHPDSLIVTAQNKMRLAKTIERHISFSGEGPETSKLRGDEETVAANFSATVNLIKQLKELGHHHQKSDWGNTIWRGVPKALISAYMGRFESHPHNFSFYTPEDERHERGLAKFIAETDEQNLQHWDIVIPGGREDERQLSDTDIYYKPEQRMVEVRDGGYTVLVSGTKARVGSRGIEREGIPKQQAEDVAKQFLSEHPELKYVSDKQYRAIRQRPLLLLHFVTPYFDKKSILNQFSPSGDPLVAIGLSFPRFDDSAVTKKVAYRVNLVEWRNRFEAEADDDIGEDDANTD